jgi:hypothetical protein
MPAPPANGRPRNAPVAGLDVTGHRPAATRSCGQERAVAANGGSAANVNASAGLLLPARAGIAREYYSRIMRKVVATPLQN